MNTASAAEQGYLFDLSNTCFNSLLWLWLAAALVVLSLHLQWSTRIEHRKPTTIIAYYLLALTALLIEWRVYLSVDTAVYTSN